MREATIKSRTTPVLRSIALALVISFGLSEVAHAAPGASALFSGQLSSNPALLKVSPSFAKVRDVHTGASGKLIIHIQDAHANLSAQDNLAKALDELIARYKIKTVFVEGGTKDDSLTFLRPLAETGARERVAKKFLMKNELSGAEYLNLASDRDFSLWGVEHKALYDKNLATYAKVAKNREAVLAYIAEISKRVESLKRRMLAPDALAFDQAVQKFEAKEMAYTEFETLLSARARQAGVPVDAFKNFSGLRAIKKIEDGIDFEKARAEQEALFEKVMAQAGSEAEALAAVKTEIAKMRSGGSTPLSFFETLMHLAKGSGISTGEYRELNRYIEYLKAYSKIDLFSLIDETRAVREAVYKATLTEPETYYLHGFSEYLDGLNKLFSLQASTEDYETYKARQSDMRYEIVPALSFINKKLSDLDSLSDVIQYEPLIETNRADVEAFYETTKDRDQIFIEKALQKMTADQSDIAVLITGGYHTPNLTGLMQRRGLSYAVVTPNIAQETNIKKYEEILLSQLGTASGRETQLALGKTADAIAFVAAAERGVPARVAAELSAAGGARLAEKKPAEKDAGPVERFRKGLSDLKRSLPEGVSGKAAKEVLEGRREAPDGARLAAVSATAMNHAVSLAASHHDSHVTRDYALDSLITTYRLDKPTAETLFREAVQYHYRTLFRPNPITTVEQIIKDKSVPDKEAKIVRIQELLSVDQELARILYTFTEASKNRGARLAGTELAAGSRQQAAPIAKILASGYTAVGIGAAAIALPYVFGAGLLGYAFSILMGFIVIVFAWAPFRIIDEEERAWEQSDVPSSSADASEAGAPARSAGGRLAYQDSEEFQEGQLFLLGAILTIVFSSLIGITLIPDYRERIVAQDPHAQAWKALQTTQRKISEAKYALQLRMADHGFGQFDYYYVDLALAKRKLAEAVQSASSVNAPEVLRSVREVADLISQQRRNVPHWDHLKTTDNSSDRNEPFWDQQNSLHKSALALGEKASKEYSLISDNNRKKIELAQRLIDLSHSFWIIPVGFFGGFLFVVFVEIMKSLWGSRRTQTQIGPGDDVAKRTSDADRKGPPASPAGGRLATLSLTSDLGIGRDFLLHDQEGFTKLGYKIADLLARSSIVNHQGDLLSRRVKQIEFKYEFSDIVHGQQRGVLTLIDSGAVRSTVMWRTAKFLESTKAVLDQYKLQKDYAPDRQKFTVTVHLPDGGKISSDDIEFAAKLADDLAAIVSGRQYISGAEEDPDASEAGARLAQPGHVAYRARDGKIWWARVGEEIAEMPRPALGKWIKKLFPYSYVRLATPKEIAASADSGARLAFVEVLAEVVPLSIVVILIALKLERRRNAPWTDLEINDEVELAKAGEKARVKFTKSRGHNYATIQVIPSQADRPFSYQIDPLYDVIRFDDREYALESADERVPYQELFSSLISYIEYAILSTKDPQQSERLQHFLTQIEEFSDADPDGARLAKRTFVNEGFIVDFSVALRVALKPGESIVVRTLAGNVFSAKYRGIELDPAGLRMKVGGVPGRDGFLLSQVREVSVSEAAAPRSIGEWLGAFVRGIRGARLSIAAITPEARKLAALAAKAAKAGADYSRLYYRLPGQRRLTAATDRKLTELTQAIADYEKERDAATSWTKLGAAILLEDRRWRMIPFGKKHELYGAYAYELRERAGSRLAVSDASIREAVGLLREVARRDTGSRTDEFKAYMTIAAAVAGSADKAFSTYDQIRPGSVYARSDEQRAIIAAADALAKGDTRYRAGHYLDIETAVRRIQADASDERIALWLLLSLTADGYKRAKQIHGAISDETRSRATDTRSDELILLYSAAVALGVRYADVRDVFKRVRTALKMGSGMTDEAIGALALAALIIEDKKQGARLAVAPRIPMEDTDLGYDPNAEPEDLIPARIPMEDTDPEVAAAMWEAYRRENGRSGARLALQSIDPTRTQAWWGLQGRFRNNPIRARNAFNLREMFRGDPRRAERFSAAVDLGSDAALFVDWSKNLLDDRVMRHLMELAEETDVKDAIKRMFTGDKINETEKRAVLHTALRAPKDSVVMVDGKNVMPDIYRVLEHMREFSEAVRSGAWKGYDGDEITDVVNIGIGGSDLGPVMASEALKAYAGRVHVHYVSNVDGADMNEKVLKNLNPKTTLFIVASKTFTTQETMTNAETAKQWLLGAVPADKKADAIKKHFVALSTNKALVEKFGIDSANMFEFWDWVGGRYSLWSAIGLSVAISVGFDNFRQMLDGAHAMDEHLRTAPLDKNIPVILALIQIWNTNFLGAQTHAVLPYSQYLHRLPAYLQQASMESNGKGVSRSGAPLTYTASPIIFGEAGTNGQHSFYQLIHQGRTLVPADFIGVANPQEAIGQHHDMLLSNLIGQTRALAFGKTEAEVRKEMKPGDDPSVIPHKVFKGNRPTNTIVINKLTPYTLGALVAMYEHIIFVQSVIMNVFAFDQWGVELGKKEANGILPAITGNSIPENLDSSSANILKTIKEMQGKGARLAARDESEAEFSRQESIKISIVAGVAVGTAVGWIVASVMSGLIVGVFTLGFSYFIMRSKPTRLPTGEDIISDGRSFSPTQPDLDGARLAFSPSQEGLKSLDEYIAMGMPVEIPFVRSEKAWPKRLVLVRHGETEWSDTVPGTDGGYFAGWTDVNLTENGRHDAERGGEALKAYMAGEPIDIAFTSDLKRAQNTLELVLKGMGAVDKTPVRFHEAIKERHYGALQGKNRGQFKKELQERVSTLTAQVRELVAEHAAVPAEDKSAVKKFTRKVAGLLIANWDLVRPTLEASLMAPEAVAAVAENVFSLWRRGYSDAPPKGESLAVTQKRAVPFIQHEALSRVMGWNGRTPQNAAISWHGNSGTAWMMHHFHITPEERGDFTLPLSIPLVVTLNENGSPRQVDIIRSSRLRNADKKNIEQVKRVLALKNIPYRILDGRTVVEQSEGAEDTTPAVSGARLAEALTVQVPAEALKTKIEFGTSGWRSNTGAGFDLDNVGRTAQSIAKILLSEGKAPADIRVSVGFDARPGARAYAIRAVEVLTANGIHADLIDQITPTPVAAEATRLNAPENERYDLAVQFTASHNPVYMSVDSPHTQQGIKVLRRGVPASDKLTGEIARLSNDAAQNGSYLRIPFDAIPAGLTTKAAPLDDLLDRSNKRLNKVFDLFGIGWKLEHRGISLIVDAMHGGTVNAVRIFSKLNVPIEYLRTTPMEQALASGVQAKTVIDPATGKEIPWRPEPLPFLLTEMKSRKTDKKVGLAFDGDGDRAVVDDLSGDTLTPNELGLIFAHYLYSKGERGPVVRTIPTSHMLDRFAAQRGLELVETPVGSKHFEPYATGDKANLLVGVEESGHVFFSYKGEIFADSAVAEGILALEIIAETGKDLKSYLADIKKELGELHYVRTAVDPTFVTADFLKNIKALRVSDPGFPMRFAEAVAAKTGKTVKASNPVDLRDGSGVKVNFADGSWTMYRVSGTDGSIRIYAEDSTPDSLKNLTQTVSDVLVKMTAGARLATPGEIETGVRYWKGELGTTPVSGEFRLSEKNDIVDITALSDAEARRLERIGAEAVLRGEGVFSILAAGASSRMNTKEAPAEVRHMVGDRDIQSKAGVPIGTDKDGRVSTYLGEFALNLSRLLRSVDAEAQKAGRESRVWDNTSLIFSNDDYRAEHDRLLAENAYYGLQPEQVVFVHQPLGSIFAGTPKDLETIKTKFTSDAAYQEALAYAKDVESRLAAGEREAVILPGERQPLGHGEYLHQLIVTGELLRIIDAGKKFIFVKNIDNYASKLDRVWLRILGQFIDKGLDFQGEVSPRAPGQKGGIAIVKSNGSLELAEDPNVRLRGADPGKAFWLNNAVAILTPRYVMDLYKKPGQSDADFIAELRAADAEGREAIAERGRSRFPSILDTKPAKSRNAASVKRETNMWQSTGLVSAEIKVGAVGVRGARNLPIEDYETKMAPAERTRELEGLRFLSTKQWTLSPAEVQKAKAGLEAAFGRPVTDRELWVTLESYQGNKVLADDLLDYNRTAPLVTPDIFASSGARLAAKATVPAFLIKPFLWLAGVLRPFKFAAPFVALLLACCGGGSLSGERNANFPENLMQTTRVGYNNPNGSVLGVGMNPRLRFDGGLFPNISPMSHVTTAMRIVPVGGAADAEGAGQIVFPTVDELALNFNEFDVPTTDANGNELPLGTYQLAMWFVDNRGTTGSDEANNDDIVLDPGFRTEETFTITSQAGPILPDFQGVLESDDLDQTLTLVSATPITLPAGVDPARVRVALHRTNGTTTLPVLFIPYIDVKPIVENPAGYALDLEMPAVGNWTVSLGLVGLGYKDPAPINFGTQEVRYFATLVAGTGTVIFKNTGGDAMLSVGLPQLGTADEIRTAVKAALSAKLNSLVPAVPPAQIAAALAKVDAVTDNEILVEFEISVGGQKHKQFRRLSERDVTGRFHLPEDPSYQGQSLLVQARVLFPRLSGSAQTSGAASSITDASRVLPDVNAAMSITNLNNTRAYRLSVDLAQLETDRDALLAHVKAAIGDPSDVDEDTLTVDGIPATIDFIYEKNGQEVIVPIRWSDILKSSGDLGMQIPSSIGGFGDTVNISVRTNVPGYTQGAPRSLGSKTISQADFDSVALPAASNWQIRQGGGGSNTLTLVLNGQTGIDALAGRVQNNIDALINQGLTPVFTPQLAEGLKIRIRVPDPKNPAGNPIFSDTFHVRRVSEGLLATDIRIPDALIAANGGSFSGELVGAFYFLDEIGATTGDEAEVNFGSFTVTQQGSFLPAPSAFTGVVDALDMNNDPVPGRKVLKLGSIVSDFTGVSGESHVAATRSVSEAEADTDVLLYIYKADGVTPELAEPIRIKYSDLNNADPSIVVDATLLGLPTNVTLKARVSFVVNGRGNTNAALARPGFTEGQKSPEISFVLSGARLAVSERINAWIAEHAAALKPIDPVVHPSIRAVSMRGITDREGYRIAYVRPSGAVVTEVQILIDDERAARESRTVDSALAGVWSQMANFYRWDSAPGSTFNQEWAAFVDRTKKERTFGSRLALEARDIYTAFDTTQSVPAEERQAALARVADAARRDPGLIPSWIQALAVETLSDRKAAASVAAVAEGLRRFHAGGARLASVEELTAYARQWSREHEAMRGLDDTLATARATMPYQMLDPDVMIMEQNRYEAELRRDLYRNLFREGFAALNDADKAKVREAVRQLPGVEVPAGSRLANVDKTIELVKTAVKAYDAMLVSEAVEGFERAATARNAFRTADEAAQKAVRTFAGSADENHIREALASLATDDNKKEALGVYITLLGPVGARLAVGEKQRQALADIELLIKHDRDERVGDTAALADAEQRLMVNGLHYYRSLVGAMLLNGDLSPARFNLSDVFALMDWLRLTGMRQNATTVNKLSNSLAAFARNTERLEITVDLSGLSAGTIAKQLTIISEQHPDISLGAKSAEKRRGAVLETHSPKLENDMKLFLEENNGQKIVFVIRYSTRAKRKEAIEKIRTIFSGARLAAETSDQLVERLAKQAFDNKVPRGGPTWLDYVGQIEATYATGPSDFLRSVNRQDAALRLESAVRRLERPSPGTIAPEFRDIASDFGIRGARLSDTAREARFAESEASFDAAALNLRSQVVEFSAGVRAEGMTGAFPVNFNTATFAGGPALTIPVFVPVLSSGGTVTTSLFDARTRRVRPTAVFTDTLSDTAVSGARLSVSSGQDLQEARTAATLAENAVNALLDALETDSSKAVIVEISRDWLPENPMVATQYLDYLISQLRALRKHAFAKNVYFRFIGDREFAEHIAVHGGDLFIGASQSVNGAETVRLGTAYRQGVRNVLVERLQSGDIPLVAALRIAIEAGRIDVDNVPSEFISAIATASGVSLSQIDAQSVSELLKGLLDMRVAAKFMLRAVTRIDINSALRYFQMGARMAAQSA